MIDNSTDFYIISNYFKKKKIEFCAIQNANRVDMPRVYKNRFVNYYFTIGDFEKKILKNKKSILNLFISLTIQMSFQSLDNIKIQNNSLILTNF